ncbi:MAG TPA: hypothetical protein GX510_04335 [Firmicutes bacterium]|nr:hypothetical protein [Candidatus Fermentithermobacillaceae bacterium]
MFNYLESRKKTRSPGKTGSPQRSRAVFNGLGRLSVVALCLLLPVTLAVAVPVGGEHTDVPGTQCLETNRESSSEPQGSPPVSQELPGSGEKATSGNGPSPEEVKTRALNDLISRGLEARGVYVTMRTAGDPRFFLPLIRFLDDSGLDALVIDVKDNAGYLPCAPPESVPGRHHGYTHFKALIRLLRENGYYLIARVVAFQDPYLAALDPGRAIRRPDGALWRDRGGMVWLNPYDLKNWEHIRNICLWAKDMGFHEIQLDYVRFPDNLPRTAGGVIMPDERGLGSRTACIKAFLKYIDEALKEGDNPVLLSADVFGFTTLAEDDMGIGQKFEEICDVVDFVSPMVYPSHYYNSGIYGFEVPEAHPYEVVKRALADALRRSEGRRAKIRPWLQDFSLNIQYGPAEVQAQIKASYEHGINTWLLWNPGNQYTRGVEHLPPGAVGRSAVDASSGASPESSPTR